MQLQVVISIKYWWSTFSWAKIIHLGHNLYQQQNLKVLSILQGYKNPHRKIFVTRYDIVNMKLIIFLKNVI